MADSLTDPVRDRLREELRAVRRMSGLPDVGRLAGKDHLIEALGEGDVARAWARLLRIHDEHGSDPATDIGAYFYLAGWDVGRETVDQRAKQYADTFHVTERTAIRRGDRGIANLAVLIRDTDETARPWGLITLFQSGNTVDVIVRLMLAFESWRPATIRINGNDRSDPDFTIHRDQAVTGGFYHQLVLEKLPLNVGAAQFEPMVSVVVHWPMPVWPTWQTRLYVADGRIAGYARTFRDRGFEVRLEWTREKAVRALRAKGLAKDRRRRV